jgi:hypothetical protein
MVNDLGLMALNLGIMVKGLELTQGFGVEDLYFRVSNSGFGV